MSTLVNQGTGAGGANTNVNGKTFEMKTENETRLLANGFTRKPIPGKKGKNSYFLEKSTGLNKSIVYLTQGGLKQYFEHYFQKELFRNPDEAYLFRDGDQYILKILEKKNQNVEGSVDTKLLAGPMFIEEYKECLGENFQVKYGFCISEFLKKIYKNETLKSKIWHKLFAKYNIAILFGDDENYYETLDAWINS